MENDVAPFEQAMNQDVGEDCTLCGVEIHMVEDYNEHGHPTGDTYPMCHGLCRVSEVGGR